MDTGAIDGHGRNVNEGKRATFQGGRLTTEDGISTAIKAVLGKQEKQKQYHQRGRAHESRAL